ncbi:MAG: methyltransferase domain-containing protein [Candidatus Binatia bacterium]
MKTPLQEKSTIDEIRQRFDGDVERFSNLETGQQATIDAPLTMELITQAAIACTPNASRILDIGCGAGNNTLKLLKLKGDLDCDLVDLSAPMLKKAYERVSSATSGKVRTFQADIRKVKLPSEGYDIILAAAVLHHLRDDEDWRNTFRRIFHLTAPGGSVWITDMVFHESEEVQNIMWERYGTHLESLGGDDYRKKVFDYIDKEDSPRPVTFQLDLLREVGYQEVDLLHKNSCFAAFGAIKSI